jgi:hypothetical protein
MRMRVSYLRHNQIKTPLLAIVQTYYIESDIFGLAARDK